MQQPTQTIFIDLTQVPDSPPPRRPLPARYANLVILPPQVPQMPVYAPVVMPLHGDAKQGAKATTVEELMCDEDFLDCVLP